jgi:hypothetical protein
MKKYGTAYIVHNDDWILLKNDEKRIDSYIRSLKRRGHGFSGRKAVGPFVGGTLNNDEVVLSRPDVVIEHETFGMYSISNVSNGRHPSWLRYLTAFNYPNWYKSKSDKISRGQWNDFTAKPSELIVMLGDDWHAMRPLHYLWYLRHKAGYFNLASISVWDSVHIMEDQWMYYVRDIELPVGWQIMRQWSLTYLAKVGGMLYRKLAEKDDATTYAMRVIGIEQLTATMLEYGVKVHEIKYLPTDDVDLIFSIEWEYKGNKVKEKITTSGHALNLMIYYHLEGDFCIKTWLEGLLFYFEDMLYNDGKQIDEIRKQNLMSSRS